MSVDWARSLFPFISNLSTFYLLERFLILPFYELLVDLTKEKDCMKDKSTHHQYFLLTLFSSESFEREVSAALRSQAGTRQFHAVGRGGLKITATPFFKQL